MLARLSCLLALMLLLWPVIVIVWSVAAAVQ